MVATTSAPLLDGRATPLPRRSWLVLWGIVVLGGTVWGTLGAGRDARQSVRAAPFHGRWLWDVDARLLLAALLGVAVATAGPRLAERVAWRRLLVLTAGGAASWALLLAASAGWHAVIAPVATRFNYLPFATTIGDPLEFLRTFTSNAHGYPVHVKGHPPGATLIFWLLDRAGLGGRGWVASVELAAWGVAAAAVLVAVRAVTGEAAARRAAPFLVATPAALWATSADALFAAVIAVGSALVVCATGSAGRRAFALAGAGGAVLAVALHLTYGTVPLLIVPAAVIAVRRRLDALAAAAAGAAAVTALFAAAGFWWLDGLAVTHRAYWAGIASRRPWPYHLLAGNPAALCFACGPAFAAGFGWVRRSELRRWLLPIAALAAVAIADASGLSKAEVERIWLPFFPWILSVAAAIPARQRRVWLVAQVLLTLGLEVAL